MVKSAVPALMLAIVLGVLIYLWGQVRFSTQGTAQSEQPNSSKVTPSPADPNKVRVGSFSAFARMGTDLKEFDQTEREPEVSELVEADEDRGKAALLDQLGSKAQFLQDKAAYDQTVEELGLRETKDAFKDHMEQSFEQEAFDLAWAYDYEGLLYEVFANDPVLAGKPIQAVECRSVRCRVQIQLRSTDDMLEVTEILVQKLVQEAEGLNYATFWSQYSVEDNTATWYIGRDREVDILQSSRPD